MNPHTLLDACLWFIAALWLVEHLVSMTRTRAPKRNRKLGTPSIHCERNPDWTTVTNSLTRRQAE